MRCKPGDLAIIVRARWPENLGALVEVLARSEHVDRDWFIRSIGRPLTGTDEDGRIGTATEGHIMDSDLRPIRGDRVTEKDDLVTVTDERGSALFPA
jgi:hypothetical protein